MKNLFSKSLMAAAAVMMFASCSNEEVLTPENPFEGKTSEVTIGMSVKGIGSKASANEVNMGSSMQDINNIVVVPVVGEVHQNPILFGSLTSSSGVKTKKETRRLSNAVTRFKVYGNVPEDSYSNLKETGQFPGLNFTLSTAENAPAGGTYYAPHGLYYHFDTKKDGGYYATTNESWDAVSWDESMKVDNNAAIDGKNCIKVGPVNYEIGVLAAAIMNGDTEEKFYNENPTENPDAVASAFTGAEISVSGVIVFDQTKTFDTDFTASELADVYEEAAVATLSSDKISSDNETKSNGNIYCVVAETPENENVSLNIEFTVNENYWFRNNNNELMAPGQKFYINVALDKDHAINSESGITRIFQKDYATVLNATVKNWGIASKEPVKSTDVTIGVEFDLDWGKGLQFDLDI